MFSVNPRKLQKLANHKTDGNREIQPEWFGQMTIQIRIDMIPIIIIEIAFKFIQNMLKFTDANIADSNTWKSGKAWSKINMADTMTGNSFIIDNPTIILY